MSATQRIDVPVAGGTLATFLIGNGREGADPVVAIHGITANSRAWLAVSRALDGRATLLAPDLRGRGASSPLPPPFGMEAYARDMLAVLLGPALARLKRTFASREAYHDWWRAHPAFAHADVVDADLVAYADHDLVGEPPELRSSVPEEVVRADAAELLEIGKPALRLEVPTELLCAERGMVDDPNPLQPPALAQAWADAAPAIRRTERVPGVHHYSLVMGAAGARAVANGIVRALQSRDGDPRLRSGG